MLGLDGIAKEFRRIFKEGENVALDTERTARATIRRDRSKSVGAEASSMHTCSFSLLPRVHLVSSRNLSGWQWAKWKEEVLEETEPSNAGRTRIHGYLKSTNNR